MPSAKPVLAVSGAGFGGDCDVKTPDVMSSSCARGAGNAMLKLLGERASTIAIASKLPVNIK